MRPGIGENTRLPVHGCPADDLNHCDTAIPACGRSRTESHIQPLNHIGQDRQTVGNRL